MLIGIRRVTTKKLRRDDIYRGCLATLGARDGVDWDSGVDKVAVAQEGEPEVSWTDLDTSGGGRRVIGGEV